MNTKMINKGCNKLFKWWSNYWDKLIKLNPLVKHLEENYGCIGTVFDNDGNPDYDALDFIYDYITYRVYYNEDEDSFDLQYILDSDNPNMNLKLIIAEDRTFEQITAIIKSLMNKNKNMEGM